MKYVKKMTPSGTKSLLNEMDVEMEQMTKPNLSLSYQARREVLADFLPLYRATSSAQKSLLLDTFVRITGYARTSAIRLLDHLPMSTSPIQRPHLPVYGPRGSRHSFWPGRPRTPSVPNVSSPFCLPWWIFWSDRGISN